MNPGKCILLSFGFLVFQSFAADQALDLKGYWADRNNPDPYESFVHLQGDRGFKCVLDQKSSFRFQVIGDSITTPMNGKNALTWYPSSGDIEISGMEKGVAYRDRFETIDSATYFAKCGAEELHTTVRRSIPASRSTLKRVSPKRLLNLLGRH